MAQRSIATSYRAPTYDVCVVGQELTLDIYREVPGGAEYFEVLGTPPIDVTLICPSNQAEKPQKGVKLPLNQSAGIVVSPRRVSAALYDMKVRVSYYGRKGNGVGTALLYLTCVWVSLDVDVKRVGAVSRGVKDKGTWEWGPQGTGAILLANCDRDRPIPNGTDSVDMGAPNAADIKDLSPMVLTAEGPEEIFEGHNLILSISPTHATKLRVYCKRKSDYLLVLGGTNLSHEVEKGNSQEMGFYVEGLDFPDADFSGLVHINLSFCRSSDSTEIFADRVAFRVAPWIMTPNTQKPLEVYVCSVQGNKKFLKELKDLVQKAKCKLNICPDVENRGDRWIQDEMEFGYTEAPHRRFPVVLDSPRDGELDFLPFKKILGPDFGYVKIQVEQRDSVSDLDSFGNLEVSPPVAVKGKNYPLGRILIGSHLPQDIEPPNPQPIKPRRMNKVVRDFLSAQLVQSPLELYSDWLMVGHIDEFMSFVPVPNKKGFRLLLASPRLCLELFREKQNEGYGGAIMFEGLSTEPHTIEKLLSNEKLLRDSTYTQGCIDRNRQILKEELGLSEGDITDIPALFTLLPYYNKAEAFYPNMVNMLVLGQYLGIPKPFGPIIDGRCCLEQKVCSLLEPQGLICTFLDDFATYHQNAGDVHCGTNVIRKPFPQKWWHCLP